MPPRASKEEMSIGCYLHNRKKSVALSILALVFAASSSVSYAFQATTTTTSTRSNKTVTRNCSNQCSRPTPTTTALFLSSSMPKTPDEMFASKVWPPIKAQLDKVPVFCCANEQGQPLQYQVNGEINMPFFYADVQAVEVELKQAQKDLPPKKADELGIIPFPLGTAFELMAKNEAVIIPGKDAATRAFGEEEGAKPLGLPLPLFGCMAIRQEKDGVLPLFVEYEEAEAAVQAAGGDTDKLEIISVSLLGAVQSLVTEPDGQAFDFVPPKESMDYINRYLGNNV